MHTTDPLRPQVNNQPAYGNGPHYPLPALTIAIADADFVVISCHLAVEYNCFRCYQAKLPLAQVQAALLAYYNNPEDFFLKAFEYTPPMAIATAKAKAKAKPSFTLEELGLL